MWCATPNARCWWCGTSALVRSRLPKPPELGICIARHRRLDVAAHDPDVAQRTIVELTERFDRSPAFQIRGQSEGALSGPADHSGERTRDRGLRSRRRDRGHFTSPSPPRGKATPLEQAPVTAVCSLRLRVALALLVAIA